MRTSQKRWNAIDALLEHFGPDELRGFYGAATKFLIHPGRWNDPHPHSKFETEPVIAAYHVGFDTFSQSEMQGQEELKNEDKEFLSKIRDAANPARRWSLRVSKRKSTKLRKEMKKRFLRYIRPARHSLRGLRHYEQLVRDQFLTRE